MLLKSPEGVSSDSLSYRGIRILPVLGKVLERIMSYRLKECHYVSTSPHQFGFTGGISTVDSLMYVQNSLSGSNSTLRLTSFYGIACFRVC